LGSTAIASGPASSAPAEQRPTDRPGGLLRDIGRLYLRPAALFTDLSRWNRSASALLLLMAVHLLYAVAVVSTGVPDYETDLAAQKEISRTEQQLRGDENSDERTRTLDALEKGAVFTKLLTRVLLVAGGPVQLLAGIGALAAVLFVAGALWGGGKPDFQLLSAVAVFAAYALVPKLLLRLLLISQLQVARVETSAAALVAAPHVSLGLYLFLRRLDPFDLWYWALVALGIWKTGQFRGRLAVVVVVVLALLAGLAQSVADVGELASIQAISIDAS
jgi:hypothetical protein